MLLGQCEPAVPGSGTTSSTVLVCSSAVVGRPVPESACSTEPCPGSPGQASRCPRLTEISTTTAPSSMVVSIDTPATVSPVVPAIPAGSYRHPSAAVEQWHLAALSIGWPDAAWPRLSCIIARESGGNPLAFNGADPGLGSFGLLQLNLSLGKSGTWALWGPALGWDSTALYDAGTNLRFGLDLYHRALRMWGNGWKPWGPGRC